MPGNDGQEKTEQPTSKRLKESREKGQTGKSMEINSLAVFSTGLITLYISRNYISQKISGLTIYIFSSLDTLDINFALMKIYSIKAVIFFFITLLPMFGVLIIFAAAAGYGQVGFKITLKALAPKFSNLNPLKGIKNTFFSSKSFVELLKSLVKLTVIGLFAYWVLADTIIKSIGLVNYSVKEITLFMVNTAYTFLWKVSLVFTVLAIADFVFQKYKFKKDLKMSKQEVKDEMKQTEGDPLVKSHIKSKQLSMSRSRMMKDVPKADVVITNPTHFAVALRYDISKDSAPVVIAKGVDLIALKIKKIAIENDIPIHEDRPLAHALYYSCDIGDAIPEKLFQTVAQILAYIYNLKNKVRKTIV